MESEPPNHETKIQYFQTRDFEKSLQKARLAGKHGQKYVNKTKAILGGLAESDPFTGIVKITKHGERRIPYCVKYDLGDGWRLVTCQHSKSCGFLFMGKHDDVDHWLDKNKGQTFAVENGRATLVPGTGAPIPYARSRRAGYHDQPVIEHLTHELADFLLEAVPRSIAKRLEALDGSASSACLQQITNEIPDPSKSEFVHTVFSLLLAGNIDGASTTVKLRSGAIPDFEDIPPDLLVEIEDGPEIRRLRIGTPEYEKWLEDIEKRTTWSEWFLFLHPEQEKVVDTDYAGTAQLSGVSGSGKTCVAVRRALRLAEAPEARVLLVTLNPGLAGLLGQLVESAGTDELVRDRILVTSFFELAQRLLSKFEPSNDRIYRDTTWKLKEHVDEVFREYYRRLLSFDAARVLIPLHLSMNARNVSGEFYLREEFDWIRSAVNYNNRDSYLDLQRRGRRFPISCERRGEVLKGLAGWEAKMRQIGIVDYLGLTCALSHHIDAVKPEYDHIIIDEAQDFGTTELRILRRLVAEGPNDLFLCGDIAQSILPKHRALAEAGIVNNARERIVRNYRNSREILMAAYDVLRNNLHEDIVDSDDLEILDPVFANFSGSVPMALYADTLEEEIAFARAYADTRLRHDVRTVCVAFAGFSFRDIRAYAARCGVAALEETYDPSVDTLVFCDLEQAKGYEFDTLIIVQCTDAVLPPADAPQEEAHRAACKLYVAMTRARKELVLSFHGSASPWITAVHDSIGSASWAELEELNPRYLAGVPELLPEVEPESGLSDAYKLSGEQFLYTRFALGLSIEAQQKLIELVDGRGLIRAGSGRRVKWPNVGALINAVCHSRMHDQLTGTVVAAELRKLGTFDKYSDQDKSYLARSAHTFHENLF